MRSWRRCRSKTRTEKCQTLRRNNWNAKQFGYVDGESRSGSILSRRSGVAEAIGDSGGNCNSGSGSNGDSGNSGAIITTIVQLHNYVFSELFTWTRTKSMWSPCSCACSTETPAHEKKIISRSSCKVRSGYPGLANIVPSTVNQQQATKKFELADRKILFSYVHLFIYTCTHTYIWHVCIRNVTLTCIVRSLSAFFAINPHSNIGL